MNESRKGLFNAIDLANYIAYKFRHHPKYGGKISNIKLQKSLYFLFAFWGAFIEKAQIGSTEIETSYDKYSKYLFTNRIEAWIYGPVVPDVYELQKKDKIDSENVDGKELFKNYTFVKETIDSLLEDIFATSDFKLVSLSHEDECWKKNFDMDEPYHNNSIDLDDIINEYAYRESL